MNRSTNPRRQKAYQVIFFDLDGTLTDPKEGITKSIQFALEKMNLFVPSTSELEWCIGPPLKDSFSKLTNSTCEIILNTALEYYRKQFTQSGIYKNHLYDGVVEMLSYLNQEGYRLFVATSKPEVFAIQIIQHFALSQYFEKIHGSELDGTRSDKSHLLKHILESNNIKEPVLMVGDRKYDVIAARQNNIDCLGVTYGYGSQNELTQAGAYHLCRSPEEVYRWICS